MTLSPEEEQRIREQEIYRSEIHKSLAKKAWYIKLWDFANTPFFHSVVVAGLVAGVGYRVSQHDKHEARNEAIRHLCIEIEYRIRQYYNEPVDDIRRQVSTLNGSFSETIFPSYYGRNFVGLLWELQSRIDDGTDARAKGDLLAIIDKWTELTREPEDVERAANDLNGSPESLPSSDSGEGGDGTGVGSRTGVLGKRSDDLRGAVKSVLSIVQGLYRRYK